MAFFQLHFLGFLSASKHNHQCSILYEKIIKEKDKKLIFIAGINKLLRETFAVAKFGRFYYPNYGLESIVKEVTKNI